MLGQVTWIDTIPGGQAGVNWLLGQVAAFNRLPSDITALEAAAVTVKRAADARGQLGASTQLVGALAGLADARDQQQRTAAHLADVMDGLRTSTPGTMPASLVASAVQTAAEVTALFSSVQAYRDAIYNLAASVLSPDELARLMAAAPKGGGFGLALGTYGKWAALLGIGYVALYVVTGRSRRGRSRG